MMKSVTKEKVFHVLKMILIAVTVTLVLLSLLGTVAHASGLVDDTVNADKSCHAFSSSVLIISRSCFLPSA